MLFLDNFIIIYNQISLTCLQHNISKKKKKLTKICTFAKVFVFKEKNCLTN